MQVRRILNLAALALAISPLGLPAAHAAGLSRAPHHHHRRLRRGRGQRCPGPDRGRGNDQGAQAARDRREPPRRGLHRGRGLRGQGQAGRLYPVLGASGPISFNPALYAKLPYKIEDFTPVSLTAKFPLVLVSDASLPIKSVSDLVAYSKQHPDKANYGSSAASFQLVTELFNGKTGARFAHIPYKGSNESIQAVMAGNVTMAITDPAPAMTGLQSKRVRALAVTSPQRADFLPEVPTMREAGVDLDVELWAGLLAPAGTPADVVQVLQREIARVVALPEVSKKMTALGCSAQASTSDEFRRLIEKEVPLWTKVARENDIKVE